MSDLMQIIKGASFEHPAKTHSFTEVCEGLECEISRGNVFVSEHPEYPNLKIYKYTKHCMMEREWSIWSMAARGLILDHDAKKVIATPFIKFFNYGEIFDNPSIFYTQEFIVTEKMDGSLGIMFYYDSKWMVATAGSFVSEQAVWATEWIHNNLNLEKIDTNNTYLFEIIYSDNKLVVDYDFEGLTLLAIVDPFGLEYPYSSLVHEASYLGVPIVGAQPFTSIKEIIKSAKLLEETQEGFVVRFQNGVRLKIKGEKYLRIFRAIEGVTPIAIWDMMLNGDDAQLVANNLPEEVQEDYWQIYRILTKQLLNFIGEIEIMYQNTSHLSDKQLGEYMAMHPEAFDGGDFENAKNYIFHMRHGKFYPELNEVGSHMRRNIFRNIRPNDNRLEGYTPTSAMNRFRTAS